MVVGTLPIATAKPTKNTNTSKTKAINILALLSTFTPPSIPLTTEIIAKSETPIITKICEPTPPEVPNT